MFLPSDGGYEKFTLLVSFVDDNGLTLRLITLLSPGGILTITAQALLDDPIGVYQHIDKIVEHPLWECLVLPYVLGGAAKASCPGKDPLAVFDRFVWFLVPNEPMLTT